MSSATTRLASSSRSVPLAERIRATVGKSRIEIRRQVNCSLVISAVTGASFSPNSGSICAVFSALLLSLCCVQGPDRLQPTVPKKCFSMEERNMQGNLFMASPKGCATFVTSRPSSLFIGSPSAPSSPSKPQKPRPVTAGDVTHSFPSTIEC